MFILHFDRIGGGSAYLWKTACTAGGKQTYGSTPRFFFIEGNPVLLLIVEQQLVEVGDLRRKLLVHVILLNEDHGWGNVASLGSLKNLGEKTSFGNDSTNACNAKMMFQLARSVSRVGAGKASACSNDAVNDRGVPGAVEHVYANGEWVPDAQYTPPPSDILPGQAA